MARRTRSRWLTPLVSALAAVLLAATPAAAVSETTSSGNVGAWIANDSGSAPGATCRYNDAFRLTKISARPPVVFAARAGGQQVGWRLRIVHNRLIGNTGAYGDTTVYNSGFQRDHATRSNPADFSRKTWVRDIQMTDSSRFKVYVVIRWYHPSSGAVEGTVSFRYDWFKQLQPNGSSSVGEDHFCYRSPF